MKHTLTLLLFLFTSTCFSQTTHTSKMQIASFVTRLHIANATKDGIYLNGYVVNISYEKAKQLDGKKIRVTGKVTIVKGFKSTTGEKVQARAGDAKHIADPAIVILKG